MNTTNNEYDWDDDEDSMLDRLLDEWASRLWADVRLPEPELLQDTMLISGDLGYEWWNRLYDRIPFHNGSFPYSAWPKAV